MFLKIQVYRDGGWWDKAYTKPVRAESDCKLYYFNQGQPRFPHRVYSMTQRKVVYQIPEQRNQHFG